MSDNEEGGDEMNARRSDWEVVSLSASAYAAAPSQTDVQQSDFAEETTCNEPETSRAMFMSGHFVFPPSQHENLPLKPEEEMIHDETAGEEDDGELSREGYGSIRKDEKDPTLKIVHDEFPGVQFLDEKDTGLSVHHSEFNPDKEPGPYDATTLGSFHSETAGGDHIQNEIVETEVSSDSTAESPKLSKPSVEEDNFGNNLPCRAWWKKRASFLYTHAKDANAFWSVFIAAAVMGLVILGQQWQQERWQLLQQKWHISIKDEKISRMLSPIYRIKDVIVGGHRRGSLIRDRGSSSSDN